MEINIVVVISTTGIVGLVIRYIVKHYEKIKNWFKKWFHLIKEAKKIFSEYEHLKECNDNYRDEIIRYNIFYEELWREYYINQIKEKYGNKLCTPEILTKYWLDDNNNWRTIIKYNGDIYELTPIGPDTLNKNIWKSFGKLNIYN